MGGKKEVAEGIVEQALKLVMGGADDAAKSGMVRGTFPGSKMPSVDALSRNVDKFVYHSGTAKDIPDMKYGVSPQIGPWVREVLEGSADNDVVDEIMENAVPVSWWSKEPSWAVVKVARELGKPIDQVTPEDLASYGHVALIPKKDPEAESLYWVGEEGLNMGPYSDVEDITGRKVKAYDADLYSGNYGPEGVERNEYITTRTVEPYLHLTGNELVDFLRKTGQYKKSSGGRTGYQTKGRVIGDAVDAAMRLIAGVEPQKTAKAYKLFKQREGKLYPLFVDANEEVPLNQWLKAKAGEQAASGKVRSKIGELAYRPGWHAGDLPIATHIGARSHGNPKLPPDTRPSDQVWAEVDMADDVDWQKIANERARMTKKGTPDPKTAHITDQVPYGGYYRYKTNPNMTGNWMIGGDMRVNRVLTDDEVKAINEAAGVSDLPRREGYGPGGFVDDIVKMAGKIVSGADEPAKTGIRAYHSSPHDFDKFEWSPRTSMTGEGAQAYGAGLYFAENPSVSDRGGDYWRQFFNKMPSGPERSAAGSMFVNKFDRDLATAQTERNLKYNEDRAIPGRYGDGPDVEEGHRLLADEERQALDMLRSGKIVGPRTYEVNINADPNQFLDWDKPLSEQPEAVRRLAGWTPEAEAEYRKASKSDTDALLAALEGESQYVPAKMPQPPGAILPFSATGDELHQKLFHQARRELEGRGASGAYSARVAEKLREAGIPGIKYLDAGSRGAGEGTRNYVVFDDRLISIIRKYGIAGASAMLGYNLMEQLDPKQALAASMADQDYQSSRPQRSMGGNNSISGALNVARGLHGGM